MLQTVTTWSLPLARDQEIKHLTSALQREGDGINKKGLVPTVPSLSATCALLLDTHLCLALSSHWVHRLGQAHLQVPP